MEVTLNTAEQKLATFLARCRYEMNRREGAPDEKIGPQSAEMTDLDGIAAEIAYCKLMNLYPDLETEHERGRPAADALRRDGHFVDVKATRYRRGHLLVRPGKKGDPSDLYALMFGQFPRYRLAGQMTAEELLIEERLKDFGHGPGYAANQGELEQEDVG